MKKVFKSIIIILCMLIPLTFTSCYIDNRKEKRILGGELNILTCNEYRPYIDKAVEIYKAYHKGVKTSVTTTTQEGIYEAVSTNKNYDLITFPSTDMYRYKDYLEDVKPYVGDFINDFDKNKLETLKIEEEMKGFPIDSRAMAMYYRKDLLNNLGISELDINTWDKFIELGKTLKEKMGIKLISVNFKGQDSFYNLLTNQLLEDFADNDDLNLFNNKSLMAFEMIKQLYDLDLINIVNDEDLPIKNALDGDTLCFLGSNAEIYRVENYIENNEFNGSLGVNKIPSFEPGGNRSVVSVLNNVGIVKTSNNKDVIKDFLKVLLIDKDVLVEGINNNMIPVYKPIYFNDTFDKGIQVLDNDKALRKFEYISRYAYVRNISKNYTLIDDFIDKNIIEIISGNNIHTNLKKYEEDILKLISEKEEK
ncbi:ABC transporter substrate-binding protein [Clostridium frigidicarnis]|nr:ABC transporter substrate-binding protein [Clostridium frigidicarnis]